MADREFLLKIVGDVSDAQKSLGNLEKDVNGFKSTASTVGKAIGGALAVGVVVDFGKAMVDTASQTEQALGASQSVFGDYADDIETFSEDTAKNLGLAQGEFLQLASLTGSLLKNTGLPMKEVTDLTTDLTERAADMAAMFGGDVDQALNAINSGLKGELNPLEAFGVSLSAAKVEAQAAAMGLLDAEGNMDAMAKATATAALIMDQSADSAGTFAKESGTLAGQTAIAQAKFADLQGELGAKLLPVITSVFDKVSPLLDLMLKWSDVIIPLVGVIGGIVLAMKAWTAIQLAFNAVMALNPIVAIALAIGAFVLLLVVAYKKVQWFHDAVDTVIHAIAAAFDWLLDQIRNWKTYLEIALKVAFLPFWLAFEALKLIIEHVPEWFTAMVDALRHIVSAVTTAIVYPFEVARNAITAVVDVIRGAFDGLIRWFSTSWGNIKAVIEAPFKAALDGIKWLWNNTIGGFGFTVPSWVPIVGGKEFKIPHLAHGGIVRRPTIALLGEAGPEAVTPLRNGMGGVVINVYALTANAEVGRVVKEALDEYARTSGALVA